MQALFRFLKVNRRMSTCKWMDLQTLGSQPIMPKNLPNHCSIIDLQEVLLGGGGSNVCRTRMKKNAFIPLQSWQQNAQDHFTHAASRMNGHLHLIWSHYGVQFEWGPPPLGQGDWCAQLEQMDLYKHWVHKMLALWNRANLPKWPRAAPPTLRVTSFN